MFGRGTELRVQHSKTLLISQKNNRIKRPNSSDHFIKVVIRRWSEAEKNPVCFLKEKNSQR